MIILLVLLAVSSSVLGNRTEIVFVILSQGTTFHSGLARDLKNDIINQGKAWYTDSPTVYMTHQDFPHPGDWVVLPSLPKLVNIHGTDTNTSWVVFLQDYTEIRLIELVEVLRLYNHSKNILVGHAAEDKEANYLHHYRYLKNFKFPNFASGFAMSFPLVQVLADKVSKNDIPPKMDFAIDVSYELAKFIRDEGRGPEMTHNPAFCIGYEFGCATYVRHYFSNCDNHLHPSSIYYAVKTYSENHNSRLFAIKHTWGLYVHNLYFFSDVEDDSIPTINLGIPNMETGHCEKTITILRHVAGDIETKPDIRWIVLADDDTILSPAGIHRLTACYNSSEDVLLGERYGFSLLRFYRGGYNYPTGGAGMILSRSILEKLVESCFCLEPDNPDDMTVGRCLWSMGVAMIHSPAFHQGKPNEYSDAYLQSVEPITFHHHYMIDPIEVYEEWFKKKDLQFFNISEPKIHYDL